MDGAQKIVNKHVAAETSNIPRLFGDRLMNAQFARTMGFETFGGAALGECYLAANRIDGDSLESWVSSWSEMAGQMEKSAGQALASNHHMTASARFLRAYNYYRAAEYFMGLSDPNREITFRKSQACFAQSMSFFAHPARKVHIAYADTHLPVYFWEPSEGSDARPTIILHTGGDASVEELYLMGGVAALRRGYNVIAFEGPGQRGFLYDNPHHPYRPDYEAVIAPVIDWALAQPTVDADRFALYAISFGGYTGSRSAATDRRIKAFVANGPMTDFYRLIYQSFQILGGADIGEAEIIEKVQTLYNQGMPGICFAIDQLRWILGKADLVAIMERMKDFRLDGMETDIRCPVLCISAAAEGLEGRRQLEEFTSNLQAPYDVYLIDDTSGGNAHCAMTNYPLLYEVIFDWLDDIFASPS